ncbi:hypothetical protein I4U23_021191 [Adineta vaga]|nr:hypothetical protein I4U23_021191 [Adineta vaga]
MGDSVDPDIIKRTQDTLGQIINAPALTEKLLNRPPVQFLQDIVKSVMKKTEFFQGLYSDEELTSAYLKEGRDNKTLFMKKLVTAVYIAVKREPEVRVSKILAGQEAEKTNLLLQALAEAIKSNVDNREVVRKTLQSLGETNENEEPAPSRDRENSEKRRSKEERSSKSQERDRDREESSSEKKSRSKDHSKEKGDTDGSSHSKKRRESRGLDDGDSEERRPTASHKRQDDDDDNDRKDDDDSKSRRPTRPTSAKGTRKHQESGSHHRPSSPKSEQPSRQPPTLVSTDRDDNDGRPLVRPTTAAKRSKLITQTSSDEVGAPSGRVLSGAQRGQGTLIIESKDTRDNDMNNDNDDDDDNFLIQEEKPSATKSFKQDDFDSRNGGGDQDDEDGDQHGGLVKVMMNSKKKLENGSEIAGQRADVKTIAQNDAQRRREREKIQKDVDKLRETIQSLTKSVVPLGKILEYLQEDYETMAKEMQQYTDEYKRTIVDLRKEKFTTDQNLEPLRAALLDFDDQIGDMKNRIIFMKKKINTNEKVNAGRLLDIIRQTK